MVADWMPGAVRRPIPYRADAGKFTAAPLGWVLHVTVSNGSPFVTFRDAVSPNRRFSHFWVSKAGVVEQYAETSGKSWAQAAGNGTYWTVETEGFPTEPLTPAQIAALAKIHTFLGVPDSLAEKPGQRGIGTHYMGGAAWGGHTCPDPAPGAGPRSRQRAAIIAATAPAPKEWYDMAVPDADVAKIAAAVRDAILNADVIPQPNPTTANPTFTVASSLEWTGKSAAAVQAALKALPEQVATSVAAKLPAGSVDVPTLTAALVAELAKTPLILGKA